MRPYADGLLRIRITCPACLKRGSVSCRFAGREVRCRRCQECFDAPAGDPYLGVSRAIEEPAGRTPALPGQLGVSSPERAIRTLGVLRLFQG